MKIFPFLFRFWLLNMNCDDPKNCDDSQKFYLEVEDFEIEEKKDQVNLQLLLHQAILEIVFC